MALRGASRQSVGNSSGNLWSKNNNNKKHFHHEGMLVFSLNSHPDLAEKISTRLGTPLAPINCSKFKNKETRVNVEISVRGKDCYIIQSGAGESGDVNDYLMELLITCYAMKTASATRIVGVIPYLPYSKQSKMRKRGAIPSKLIANLMCRAGLDTIITMDLHSKEVQGFYDCPVENLRASPFLIQYIQQQVPDYRNAIIVSKNPQSAARATSFAERLRLGLAVIHGESKEVESDICDGRQSPPPATDTHMFQFSVDDSLIGHVPPFRAKEKPPMNIVGDVGGKIAIIVDDIIDDAEPFVNAAALLKERGAYKIIVMGTHGLLSDNSPEIIEDSDIDEVVVTNTVGHEDKKTRCSKIKTVDISMMLSEAVRRIHNGESMGYLFRDIPLED